MRTRSRDRSNRQEDEENQTPGSLAVKSRESLVRCINRGNPCKQTRRKREDCTPSLVESTEKTKESLEWNSKQNLDSTLFCVGKESTLAQQDAGGSVSSNPPLGGHDATESFWEDGAVSNSNMGGEYPYQSELTVEFTELPSSSRRKPVRRVSVKEKELAELVHKVHLLCLLARGRLVDSACNDPLIQASLLSLVPPELLKLADAAKLTTNMLTPLVRWFHNSFKIRNSGTKEGSSIKNLAFALGTHEGTAEEAIALSVALFRALNIPARFVSILDAVSLKPEICISGSSHQDGSMLDARVSSSVRIAASPKSNLSSSPHLLDSSSIKNSHKGDLKIRRRNLAGQTSLSTGSDVVEQPTDEISGPSTLVGNKVDTCATMSAEKTKRGDLEFELQLEMALAATAAGVHDNGSGPCMTNPGDLLHQTPPSKKMKTKGVETVVSPLGNEGAVWSRRTGPPMSWSEVYCSGEALTGRWVHVDITNAIVDGEQRVEAAHAACRRPLKYVVAFAGNGAKDVTRRYCNQWYKVAPHRVCSEWWDAVLAPLKELESKATGGAVDLGACLENTSCEIANTRGRSNAINVSPKEFKDSSLPQDYGCPNGTILAGISEVEVSKQHAIRVDIEASTSNRFTSRNSLEDMELETRALTEPLPTNQQAYRNHPLYAIEKWLTKYQILHPNGPVLGYCSGHPVYPRGSVQTLQTKYKWRCDGLQVKAHEVPAKVIKRYPKNAEMQRHDEPSVSEADNHANIELYGRWQMEPLCLPHAANGIVPKNERGQVDVWSEKCLPPGTVHLRLPRLVQVAKRLEIDFAPAMVGFDFRSGRALPVFEGIVICTEFKEAILVAYAEEEERREVEEKKRNESQALSRWYQLISSMVTRQRLSNSYGGAASSYSQPQREQRTDMPKSTDKKEDLRTRPRSLYDRINPVSDDNHEHTFPLEDQSFDEENSMRTKRCPCGFSIQMEEL